MKKFLLNFLIILVFAIFCGQLLAAELSGELPADIKKCHYGDTNCIADSMNDVIKRYAKGIPEIGLRAINKIVSDTENVIFNKTGMPTWRFIRMLNRTIYGFENTTITRVEGFGKDPDVKKMEIYGRVPSLVHKGSYQSRGKSWYTHLNSSGESTTDFQNFRFSLKLKVFVEYRNEKRHLKIYELVPTIEIDKWIIWLEDLYKENTDFTVLINKILNEHWFEFWNELEPRLVAGFTVIFQDLLQNIFDTIAYDDMFLKY